MPVVEQRWLRPIAAEKERGKPGYVYSPADYDEFRVYGHRTITELQLIENIILKCLDQKDSHYRKLY